MSDWYKNELIIKYTLTKSVFNIKHLHLLVDVKSLTKYCSMISAKNYSTKIKFHHMVYLNKEYV